MDFVLHTVCFYRFYFLNMTNKMHMLGIFQEFFRLREEERDVYLEAQTDQQQDDGKIF